MVYLEGNKDVTIDQLIKILQKAKSNLGGKTKVLVSFDDEFRSIEIIDEDIVEGDYGYYDWVGFPDEVEDEDLKDNDLDCETVLTLIASN